MGGRASAIFHPVVVVDAEGAQGHSDAARNMEHALVARFRLGGGLYDGSVCVLSLDGEAFMDGDVGFGVNAVAYGDDIAGCSRLRVNRGLEGGKVTAGGADGDVW